MKKSTKFLSILSCTVMLFQLCILGASAQNTNYTIISPYEDVVWSGDNAWGAYKGTLHSHTTYSDADVDLPSMVKEYYNQGYDFLANSDHGVTGVEWNKEPAKVALYTYQKLLGNKVEVLTDEEYSGIISGSYPLYDGTARNKGMTCVTGANELGFITLTKSHVNGYFLPSNVGNAWDGGENGYETAVAFIEQNGGLSHINHPGDWLETNKNPNAVNDPANIKYFGDILLKYPSCLGTEVFNERNGTTGYDRILWDNLLMYCLPYGKNVIGFSNTDAHFFSTVDSSYSIFMMEENTQENIKETMQSGSFFAVTRKLRGNDFEIGPKESFDVINNKDYDVPMFTLLETNGHTITSAAENASEIQWIANGKVIMKKDIAEGETVTLDLDQIEGAEDFLYVRAELKGDGGMCISQAFVIDDGSEHLKFEDNTSFVDKIVFWFKSTRIYVIFQELIRAIA